MSCDTVSVVVYCMELNINTLLQMVKKSGAYMFIVNESPREGVRFH